MRMLATCAADHCFDWEKHIRKVCMVYNISVQASTSYKPFYVMFGWQARLPLDVIYGALKPVTQSPSEHALQKQMTEAFAVVRSKLETQLVTQHQHQKDFYNEKAHGKSYKPVNLVWLRTYVYSSMIGRGKSCKLQHPWTGPYRVVKK